MNEVKIILQKGNIIDYIFLFLFNMMLKFAYILFRANPNRLKKERAELIMIFYNGLYNT